MSDDTLPGTRVGDLADGDVDAPDVTPVVEPETEPGTEPDPSETKPGRRKKHKGFVRRHKFLIAIAVVLALVAGTAGGYYWWLNNQLSNIPRINVHITPGPNEQPSQANQTLNILLLGADNGRNTESVQQDLKDGTWTPFVHRSDTIMIAHIPADRKSVQIVSIPRDTWVPIQGYPYDNGHAKINAAFAYGGPELAIRTVENLTGIHIDHLAIIDWHGFKDLTTALGGVRVYIPHSFYDDSQRIEWKQGWHTFEGQEALAYVRTRHGLTNGDFDRIARQQNFMRATMGKLLSSTHNVITMTKVVNTITKYLTIDSTWTNDEIKNLALSLIGIHSKDVTFMTAPLGSYATTSDGQSIVKLAEPQTRQLFRAVRNDNIDQYLIKYPSDSLHGSKHVD
jgi:LCP family protein required for cell wall assembly